jgi:2-methylcitrate dehydratase PrpD
MEATERLASFVELTRFEALPAEVVTAAKRVVLDTLGVTVAGVRGEGSRILLASLTSTADAGAATVLGTDLRASPAQAALANGALGHALDFDDVIMGIIAHPSVPVLPAVLAVAEKSGGRGREALTAFAVGLEVECRLGNALGPSSYARGWHATPVLGALGAAAACANLLRLDLERTQHALGIATSMASGTRQNFGTMTKPLHAGLAARAGVEAAQLASRGFTAAPGIIEAPMGFGVLFSPDGDWRPEEMGDPGRPWGIVDPGISVKKYPCCFMTHAALDATLTATGARPHEAREVEAIEVRVPVGSVSALIHHRPTTGLEGKFSMEYCVAAAVIDGGVRLRSFDDESVQRPAVQELLRRVSVVEVRGEEEGALAPTRATLWVRDGSSLTAEVMGERGSPEDPLSWEELVAKYRDCTGRVLPEDQVARALDLITNLDQARIEDLTRALSQRGQSAQL